MDQENRLHYHQTELIKNLFLNHDSDERGQYTPSHYNYRISETIYSDWQFFLWYGPNMLGYEQMRLYQLCKFEILLRLLRPLRLNQSILLPF